MRKYLISAALIIVICGGLAFLPRPSDLVRIIKCKEKIVPTDNRIPVECEYPSRLMKIGDTWICSCRSEEQTLKGIKP